MRHFDVPDLSSEALTQEYLESLDCTLIATDHTAFDYNLIVKHSKLVVDTRNATKNVTENREVIFRRSRNRAIRKFIRMGRCEKWSLQKLCLLLPPFSFSIPMKEVNSTMCDALTNRNEPREIW